ncbi:hypothetical protein GGX14DRAFT_349519 [Mycena pura]|uniref:CxC5 like cysteine cluster associated with KDZ domain-containing protein n=1 Tax=Mycena pura TaxID=153505 RepID=A0AAD7E2I6_9AGAR|nr:hypothetical protein GGX14DRAFT_349519 [Mycena pura]
MGIHANWVYTQAFDEKENLTFKIAGAETIVPPATSCTRAGCNSATLSEKRTVEARLYTLRRGILPIFSQSLYCRHCHTRYYHNYSVQEAHNPAAQREYYSTEIPNYIHVFESCYVERALCVYFETQLCLSHATSGGIARVYNCALAHTSEDPSASRLKDELAGDLVLDSFFLHALLRDKRHRGLVLKLPHHGHQNHRFDEALAERNYFMVGTGQEMWAHTCNRCTKMYQGADGNWYRMAAGVHDGVTVRHVACSVHDCKEALLSQRDLFCYSHRDLLKVCCIRGCDEVAESGYRTCTEPTHRAFQTAAEQKNTAIGPNNGLEEPTAAAEADVQSSLRLKGRLYRNWTHNEQLFVRCCGVIISRATFFGSEGVSGVNTFLKATFPPQFPKSLPSYIFYDNNCQFLKHLRHIGDTYFDSVGLPVDVFHFNCKHTIRDAFCQINCNPARFKELIGADGKWVFNSSAAEQANVWFGKFQNVVQDMPVIRYNFFLDEMIAIRNREIVKDLTAQGQGPHLLSEEFLRGTSLSSIATM